MSCKTKCSIVCLSVGPPPAICLALRVANAALGRLCAQRLGDPAKRYRFASNQYSHFNAFPEPMSSYSECASPYQLSLYSMAEKRLKSYAGLLLSVHAYVSFYFCLHTQGETQPFRISLCESCMLFIQISCSLRTFASLCLLTAHMMPL